MEIQEIRSFLSVARHKSFSGAAVSLGYSQSAVTVHIQNLERELDCHLFDRLGKSVTLTDKGNEFYPHAVRILQALQEAQDSVRSEEEVSGKLRIGVIDSICSAKLPDLLEKYHRSYPLVGLSVTTDTPAILLDLLRHNRLDCVYLLDEKQREPWMLKAFEREEPILFAASASHPAVDGKSHRIEDLISYPFVLTEKEASYRKVLDRELLLRQKTIDPIFECNNTDLILNMVRNRMGITFLPRYSLQSAVACGDIAIIEVPDIQISVWQQMIYHKDKWVNRPMGALFDLFD